MSTSSDIFVRLDQRETVINMLKRAMAFVEGSEWNSHDTREKLDKLCQKLIDEQRIDDKIVNDR